MRDLIDRQDAIEELRDVIVKDVQSGDELTDGYNDGIDMAITVISKLPSAQPEQRWIPCSERLPEEDGEYLVESTRGYEVLYYREEEKQFGLMVVNFAGNLGFVPKKVYEWMPIPGAEE